MERCLACEADGEQGEIARQAWFRPNALCLDAPVHCGQQPSLPTYNRYTVSSAHHRPRKRGNAPRLRLMFACTRSCRIILAERRPGRNDSQ